MTTKESGMAVTTKAPSARNRTPAGSALRALRLRAGVSQATLANACGIGHSTIANAEVGRKHLSEKVLRRLARTLGVTEELLLRLLPARNPGRPRTIRKLSDAELVEIVQAAGVRRSAGGGDGPCT